MGVIESVTKILKAQKRHILTWNLNKFTLEDILAITSVS